MALELIVNLLLIAGGMLCQCQYHYAPLGRQ